MKWRLQDCRGCKEETWHRVKRKAVKPHGGGRGGTRYVMEHCTQCNVRWYDGKIKGREVQEKRPRHIIMSSGKYG